MPTIKRRSRRAAQARKRFSEWYAEHREERLKKMIAYNKSHPEKTRERTRNWKILNREKVRDSNREYHKRNPWMMPYYRMKRKAEEVGLPFDIKHEDVAREWIKAKSKFGDDSKLTVKFLLMEAGFSGDNFYFDIKNKENGNDYRIGTVPEEGAEQVQEEEQKEEGLPLPAPHVAEKGEPEEAGIPVQLRSELPESAGPSEPSGREESSGTLKAYDSSDESKGMAEQVDKDGMTGEDEDTTLWP